MAEKLGFTSSYSIKEEAQLVRLRLNEPTDDWQRETDRIIDLTVYVHSIAPR